MVTKKQKKLFLFHAQIQYESLDWYWKVQALFIRVTQIQAHVYLKTHIHAHASR